MKERERETAGTILLCRREARKSGAHVHMSTESSFVAAGGRAENTGVDAHRSGNMVLVT